MNVEAIDHYIHTQRALGNWPHDNVWASDAVLVTLVDTYDSVAGDEDDKRVTYGTLVVGHQTGEIASIRLETVDRILGTAARWRRTGEWTWG